MDWPLSPKAYVFAMSVCSYSCRHLFIFACLLPQNFVPFVRNLLALKLLLAHTWEMERVHTVLMHIKLFV